MASIRRWIMRSGAAAAFTCAGTLGAHAEPQPGPGYLLVEINVKDPEGFKEYAERATRTVEQYGGDFVILGGKTQTIEGPDPDGTFVVIKFSSVEAAKKWLDSPEYGAVKGIRHRTAETRQYLVEGLPTE